MRRLAFPCLFLCAAAPATAFAESATGVATIGDGAVARQIVIDGKLWRCADGRCQGPADRRRIAAERACKDLARQAGAVEAFAIGDLTLDAEQLAACNRSAKAP